MTGLADFLLLVRMHPPMHSCFALPASGGLQPQISRASLLLQGPTLAAYNGFGLGDSQTDANKIDSPRTVQVHL